MTTKKQLYSKIYVFLLWLCLFPGMVWAQYDDTIIYLEWVNDPLRTMVVNWVRDAGGTADVLYRRRNSSESWDSESGHKYAIPGTDPAKVRYSVEITGLSPGTAYEFTVDGNSQVHYFRTAPASPRGLKFTVGGDLYGNRDDASEQITIEKTFDEMNKIVAKQNPYFVVFGGDLAHAEGNPDDGILWFKMMSSWYKYMKTPDGEYLIPVIATAGNHDVPNRFGDSPEDAIFFHAFFSYPQEQWGEKKGYGAIDFGDYLSIVTLDSDHTHRVPGAQTAWLEQTLGDRENRTHVFPVYHVPGWPSFYSFHRAEQSIIRNNWHSVFVKYNIRRVFEHHDHMFKRTRPIGDCSVPIENKSDCNFSEDGVIYTGGGAWGSLKRVSDPETTPVGEWYREKLVESENNFALVEISDTYRKIKSIGVDGRVLDESTDFISLQPPEISEPSEVSESGFIAHWEGVEGATRYRLDVAPDENFTSLVNGFNDRNTGDVQKWVLTGLEYGEYYYRVRAENALVTSAYSETAIVVLEPEISAAIDPNASVLTASPETIRADGEMQSVLTATVVGEDGELLEGMTVSLSMSGGSSQVIASQQTTGSDGQAFFTVSNTVAEEVTYTAHVGEQRITQPATVSFIPRAPVVLAATSVQERSFTANWEVVGGAVKYLLDVSSDEDFSGFTGDYNGFDTGNQTRVVVENVAPGTTYYYRLRAETEEGLIGANSIPVQVTTFPDTPVVAAASGRSATQFQANWEAAEGVESYRLDVAEDPGFSTFVYGYENVDAGQQTEYPVTGLFPGTMYYYRVRSQAQERVSGNSETMESETVAIDIQASEVTAGQMKVLANGEQKNTIFVTVRGDNGTPLPNTPVELVDGGKDTNIEPESEEAVTDEEGRISFKVSSREHGDVTYSAKAGGLSLIGEVTVEYLPEDGELHLGDNFPNPFNGQTRIPLNIPKPMHVELSVSNVLGVAVRILKDEQMNTGYYEIPFETNELASGIYFYRLITDEGIKTGKMVLVK